MSYFIIVTGDIPDFETIPGVTPVPAAQAQDYVATRVKQLFPPEKVNQTYLIDDSTYTSDDLMTQSSELIFENTPPEETPLFKVLLPCLDRHCTIRIWYASGDPDAHRKVERFSDRGLFLKELLSRMTKSEDVYLLFEPA